MAHTCPDCGCVCYCNGDIDDCVLDDRAAENICTCCPLDIGEDDFPAEDDEDLEMESGT